MHHTYCYFFSGGYLHPSIFPVIWIRFGTVYRSCYTTNIRKSPSFFPGLSINILIMAAIIFQTKQFNIVIKIFPVICTYIFYSYIINNIYIIFFTIPIVYFIKFYSIIIFTILKKIIILVYPHILNGILPALPFKSFILFSQTAFINLFLLIGP